IDLEGIPSLGIAATLDVSTYESALALFFDSANPSKSLVAGALSNVNLRDIARTLAGQTSLPPQLDAVLGLVALQALGTFSIPAAQAAALDQRNLAAIAGAFKQYGQITLASASDQILLVINQPGASWHLTDLSTMKHYSLALQGNTIAVNLQPQLYLAPQPTAISSLQYPSGFNVIAHIDYLLIQAEINIQISPRQGIAAEVDLAPIIVYNPTFLALTGANGQGGPRLSLATYAQPQLADPQLRDPHLLLSGKILLLGADLAGVSVRINEQGLNFQVHAQVNPALHVDLSGDFDRQGHLSIQGGLLVGIDRSLDLGQLGTLPVKTNVNGQLSVSSGENTPSASVTGEFVFQSPLFRQPRVAAEGNTPSASVTGEFVFL